MDKTATPQKIEAPKKIEAPTETEQNTCNFVVPAGGLQFVTPSGNVIAKLMSDEAGPLFTLFNQDGLPAVSFGCTPQGGAIFIQSRDTQGYARVEAVEGGGLVNVGNAAGSSVVQLASSSGGGSVQIANHARHCKAMLEVVNDSGYLGVNNAEGEKVVAIGGGEGRDGDVLVTDRSGARIFAVPAWKYADSQPQRESATVEQETAGA